MKPTTLGLVFAAVLAVSSTVADEHDEGITLNHPDKGTVDLVRSPVRVGAVFV